MKRFTSILSIALALAYTATAQTADKGEKILISKSEKDGKITEQYLVKSSDVESADFQAHFPLNISTLQENFGNNASQMKDLSKFVTQSADTLMHISSVAIKGTASPDGIPQKNANLATARAMTMKNCVLKQFPKAKVSTTTKVYTWAECIPAIKDSKLADKQSVIAILGSKSHTEEQKEAELHKYPEAWEYLKTTVLPPMRSAEADFDYTVDKIVEKVLAVAPKPAPQPKPAQSSEVQQKPKAETEKRYPVAVVETTETGIIVEVPPKEHKHHRREKKNR